MLIRRNKVVSSVRTECGILVLCVQGTFDLSTCTNTVWSFTYSEDTLTGRHTENDLLTVYMCLGGLA